VRNVGVLQSLIVAKSADGYELVAGHRRLEAAKLAGLTEVPARVTSIPTDKIDVLAVVENIQRSQMNPADEIAAVARLAHVFDGNQAELAQTLGKSKSYVSRCIKAARVLADLSCAGATRTVIAEMSKSAIFELADAANPKAALAAAVNGKKESIRQARADTSSPEGKTKRKPSGALPGGRAVADAIKLRETRSGGFTLRLNFHPDRSPASARAEIIKVLEKALAKLKEHSTG
jgi:ParB family chromosome partitioning protein